MAIEKTKVNRYLGIILLTLICGFVVVLLLQISSLLLGPSKRACTKKVCLARFLEGPPAFNDDTLKSYLLKNYFEESYGPYALSGNDGETDYEAQALSTIEEHFAGKKYGKYVVLGAGDGEYRDLTLNLERKLGWTGLLIEPHPQLYKKLKSKGRKATLSSACVSPFAYPSKVELAHEKIRELDTEEKKITKYRMSKVKQLWSDDVELDIFKTQCIPLENLLYAADINEKIDLLILDMSGSDLDILLNVRLDILPELDMIIVRAQGTQIGNDIGGYFLERNVVVKKVIGNDPLYAVFILGKFQADEEL